MTTSNAGDLLHRVTEERPSRFEADAPAGDDKARYEPESRTAASASGNYAARPNEGGSLRWARSAIDTVELQGLARW